MIIWKGQSEFDGSDIVAIMTSVTRKCHNVKTADMAQVYILPEKLEPHIAVKEDLDEGVCGDCELRGRKGCYVRTEQAPLSVHRAYKRGSYDIWRFWEDAKSWGGAMLRHTINSKAMRFKKRVRLGAYGDLGALPAEVVAYLLSMIDGGWTGYTHAWRKRPDLAICCMASVHNIEAKQEANAQGWRTFRTLSPWDTLEDDEILCPSDKITCEKCGICDGNATGRRNNVAVPAHGASKNKLQNL